MEPPRIGTSGWYYKHWIGRFYSKDMDPSQFLEHYCRFYDTVELNGVFYRLPKPEMVKQWYRRAPKNFIFAYKGSRFITHIKRLKDPKEPLRLMFQRADLLKEKLGPILFQLPPFFKIDLVRLKSFLEALPRGYRYVFEFRNPTWFSEATYNLLEKHHTALCLYNMKGEWIPEHLTAALVYVRMHGSEGKYAGNYPKTTLRLLASKIDRWRKDKHPVFIYFNNDVRGHALKNADELKALLRTAS